MQKLKLYCILLPFNSLYCLGSTNSDEKKMFNLVYFIPRYPVILFAEVHIRIEHENRLFHNTLLVIIMFASLGDWLTLQAPQSKDSLDTIGIKKNTASWHRNYWYYSKDGGSLSFIFSEWHLSYLFLLWWVNCWYKYLEYMTRQAGVCMKAI